jgi:hypothetical protein
MTNQYRPPLLNDLALTLQVSLDRPANYMSDRIIIQVTEVGTKVREVSFHPDEMTVIKPILNDVVAFDIPVLKIRGKAGIVTQHSASDPDGKWTVSQILQAVLECERTNRPKTEWFGSPDIHHGFFEGLFYDQKEDYWDIFWGS